MANKPLQTIKFPGLTDTYTVPQVDSNFVGTAGQVPDSKKVHDEIDSLKEDLNIIDGRVTALEQGGTGSGLTEDIKQALLQIAQKVAYVDAQGQDYYDDLYDALYPPAVVTSISASYNNSNPVYDSATLDDLKQYLTVTAQYSDGTSAVVTTYTLSGTIAIGTQTITVTYSDKTTTFTITVVATPGTDPTAWEDGVAYPNTVIDDEYANVTGEIKHYAGWSRSEMLPIYGASKLQFPTYGTSGTSIDRLYCSFYNEDKTWLERFPSIPADNTGGLVDVPINAYWFIISGETSKITAIMNNGLVPIA